ncbi:MAG: DUF58 domain-containing protein [Planctomycetia bacterium]|nr:DUF58 domain-containing protein [Planctomycetia bacterium]
MSVMRAEWNCCMNAVTYDFCPSANRWVYWMKHPAAAIGFAALAACAAGVFINPAALVPGGALVVTLVLGYFWPRLAMRGVSASLSFGRNRADENEASTVHLTVVNRWPFPVWGLMLEGGFQSTNEGVRDLALAFARVGAWSTSEFSWEFVADCRGEYPRRTPKLVTGFPFGLKRAGREVEVVSKLLVRPRTFEIEELLDAAETRPNDDHWSDNLVGECGDMLGTRPFRPGDSLRRVHWAQTARYDRLIVCERQASSSSSLEVDLDADPNAHRGQGSDSSWEWSIRIAASLCRAYHRQNARVVCHVGGEEIVVMQGAAGFERFLDYLARLPQHGTAVSAERVRGRKSRRCADGLRIAVTTDLGMARHESAWASRLDRRAVVLRAAAFAESATTANLMTLKADEADRDAGTLRCECPPESTPILAGHIIIDDVRNLSSQFGKRWRRACRAA